MRKGQVTAFIIIGLLLLLAVGLSVFLIGRQVTTTQPRITVPPDARPVFDYVQGCLGSAAKEALTRLGAQGGYLEVPPLIARTPSAYIPLDPTGFFKVPLWYYEGEMRVPVLGEMERQLALSIRDGIHSCVNLDAFPDATIEEQGELVPKVELGDEGVSITIHWPILIKKGDKQITLDTFADDLDVPVKRMWETGKTILDEENRVAFFENATLSQLVTNPAVPFSGMEFSCGLRRWRIADVRSAIQDQLRDSYPFIRLDGVTNPPYEESLRAYNQLRSDRERIQKELEQDKETLTPPSHTPADAYDFYKLTFRAGIAAPDLRAGFDYQPEWGIKLNIQPNDGAYLKSNIGKAAKYIPLFCMNQWHFAYDIIYPVRAALYAPKAFKGEGYRFQFGFPVVIEANQQARRVFGYRRFISTDSPAEFCETPGSTVVDARAMGIVEGGFAAEELKDANVTFRCVAVECPLGLTSADEGHYRLRAALPEGCANGFLDIAKDGYLPGRAQIPIQGGTVEAFLPRLPKLSYTVVKHPYFEVDQRLGAAEPLGSHDQAVIFLTYRNGTLDEVLPFPQTNASETAAIPEITGHYDVSIQLLDPFGNIVGGYEAENLKIPATAVAGSTMVTFHVVEYRPIPNTDDLRARMYGYLADGSYVEQLRPTFQ